MLGMVLAKVIGMNLGTPLDWTSFFNTTLSVNANGSYPSLICEKEILARLFRDYLKTQYR